MRMLLVNDDGIFAAGLAGLREAVEDMGAATVVAPDSPQSAAGRSITLHAPISCRRMHVDGAFWGIGVAGSPADCVKLAVRKLMDSPPELVLAGINAGANVGVNVFYSGTVAAAAEGCFWGFPRWRSAWAAGRWTSAGPDGCAAGCSTGCWPSPCAGELVNVNIPALGEGGPRGVKVVPQSAAAITEQYVREDDEEDPLTFRLTDYYEHGPQETETDVTALAGGFITITPLCCDLTDRDLLAELGARRWPNMPG